MPQGELKRLTEEQEVAAVDQTVEIGGNKVVELSNEVTTLVLRLGGLLRNLGGRALATLGGCPLMLRCRSLAHGGLRFGLGLITTGISAL